MSQKNSIINKKSKISIYLLIPVLIIITILPLIVKMHTFDSHLSKYPWFSSNDTVYDFFLYYKSIFFITICSLLVIILIYKYFTDKNFIKLTPIFIPLGIYAILVLLSSILSEYSYFSFNGFYEQFESCFVVLGYCLIAYYTYLVFQTEDHIKLLVKWWKYGIIVLCLIGLSQFIGHDFFATIIGKKLITPSSVWDSLDSLTFSFGKNTVYSTLYNPNYVGFYATLVSPIFFVLSIFSKTKKERIINVLILISLLLCMFGSGSRNAFLCLGFSCIFIMIFFRKSLIKKWRYILFGLLLIIVAFAATNVVTDNLFINRLKEIVNIKSEDKKLKSIITNDNNVSITYNNKTIHITFNADQIDSNPFTITDTNDNPVVYSFDLNGNTAVIQDQEFSNIHLQLANIGEVLGFIANIDGKEWIFTNQANDGTYYYYNRFAKFDKIVDAESSIFTNYESIAGRGYIWSRTIPLLKNNILLGSGADTFAFVYPQQDYVGLYNNGFGDQILTKPHSLYLQIGVQTGVLSLICILLFYALYFISSIKLYIHNTFDTYLSQLGVGIFIGTIGYMISALANDSTITIAPTFWILIGLGISINNQISTSKIK